MTDKFICNMCGGELTKLRVDEYNPISKKTYTHALVCPNYKCHAYNLNEVYIEETQEEDNLDILPMNKNEFNKLWMDVRSIDAVMPFHKANIDRHDEEIEEIKKTIHELNLKYWHRLTLLEDYVFMNDVDLQKKISKIRGEDPRQKKITDVNPKNEC